MTTQLSDAARELELYVENSEWIIKPATIAIGKAHQRGDLNRDKALKYLTNRCRDCAKQYALDHGWNQGWKAMFPLSDRKAAAESILENMLAEFNLKNYWS